MKQRPKFVTLVLLLVVSVLASVAHAEEQAADPWAPLRRFVGEWSGTSAGEPGEGTVSRKYAFIMNGRFIHETNTSRYPPRDKDKPGEVHEHWGFFSVDKARKVLVLRQFHVEGFVNTYRLSATPEGQSSLVFDSEAFENLSPSWKARESYEFMSDDEFVETFELAPPSKPFQVYSRNHFKRVVK